MENREIFELDDRDYANYLRGFSDQIERVREGKAYLDHHASGHDRFPQVTTIILNSLSELLAAVDRKNKS